MWTLTVKKRGILSLLQKGIPSLLPQPGPPSGDCRANWVSSRSLVWGELAQGGGRGF